jgi:NAD(P)-dependent dehydrogenase (short-subunit alcohol dehydrogenase family)
MTRRPLADRVVLLTGITAGIGRSTALRLVDRGARVVGCARDLADLDPGPVRSEWLPRSAGSVPGEPDRIIRPGPGVPAGWVTRAVERCLTGPGSRTVGVPRVLEVARLALVPGVDRALDHVFSHAAPQIAAWAVHLARKRVHGPPPG